MVPLNLPKKTCVSFRSGPQSRAAAFSHSLRDVPELGPSFTNVASVKTETNSTQHLDRRTGEKNHSTPFGMSTQCTTLMWTTMLGRLSQSTTADPNFFVQTLQPKCSPSKEGEDGRPLRPRTNPDSWSQDTARHHDRAPTTNCWDKKYHRRTLRTMKL